MRLTHRLLNDFVIIRYFIGVHRLLERNTTSIGLSKGKKLGVISLKGVEITSTTHPKLLDKLLDDFIIVMCQLFLIGHVEFGIRITPRAQIFINSISFGLKNAYTAAMKPIRAVFAPDVKPIKNALLNNKLNFVFSSSTY